MPLFRKLPVEIEAFQLPVGALPVDVPSWVWLAYQDKRLRRPGEGWAVHTLEGVMSAYPGDWLIQGVAGELYPCKREIFEATYTAVDEATACAAEAEASSGRDFPHLPDADGGYG